MSAAPKDQPILAWCHHEWPTDEQSQKRLGLYQAHAEGLSHVEDGPHVIEWGGGWHDHEDDGGAGLPDWWFRWDSEWEVAANPIAWQRIEPVKVGKPDDGYYDWLASEGYRA